MGFVAIAGLALSALSQMKQGQAAAASESYNAGVAQNNAEIARQNAAYAGAEGDTQVDQQQQRTRAMVGAIKSSQAASGIDVNRGSAADIQASENSKGMLDALTIRSNAARKAYGYQTDAATFDTQADMHRKSAKSAKQGGLFGAGSTILGGALSGNKSGLFSSGSSSASSSNLSPGGFFSSGGGSGSSY